MFNTERTKSTHKGVNQRSKYVIKVQQQRPESPTVAFTWHACKYKVHKLHQSLRSSKNKQTNKEQCKEQKTIQRTKKESFSAEKISWRLLGSTIFQTKSAFWADYDRKQSEIVSWIFKQKIHFIIGRPQLKTVSLCKNYNVQSTSTNQHSLSGFQQKQLFCSLLHYND